LPVPRVAIRLDGYELTAKSPVALTEIRRILRRGLAEGVDGDGDLLAAQGWVLALTASTKTT